MAYVELKCKTNFSFLRGASAAHEYALRAQLIGMPALAITDVNGVYSLPRMLEAITEFAPELKMISGAQVTVKDHPPITLLAQSRKAYGLLCRILTQVHAGKEKGTGFIHLSELTDLLSQFSSAARELVCLPNFFTDFLPGVSASANLEILKELFPGNLYLPLCRYLDGMDKARTREVLAASKRFLLPIIATNDVHYHAPERRPLQDCLTCIREGVNMDTAGFHLFGNEERYLKSEREMQWLFSDLPEALSRTLEVAEKCQFHLKELKYSYPNEFIPEGYSAATYLRQLVYEGAHELYGIKLEPNVVNQIERELAFFAKRGDEHYFLTVQDIVRFARSKDIICQGRGSAANSIVCYVLGITSVDPIEMELLFDRFMNEGRKEPPDIDIDFEHERREEVIQYIYNKFGRDRAAMVAAVRTYRSKSSFLELSKAVGIEVGTISAGELKDNFDSIAKEKKDRRFFVETLAEDLKKFPRHLSIHSGGFVLSNDPLIEMVPVEPARMEGRMIIQWDKDDLETLGLMKVDVLSIGFLTALHKACDLVDMDWRSIPGGDEKTYKMIQRAETHGTFQIESRAQMNMLVQTLPEKFYDLVVEVALVRPSPTSGGMVRPYIQGLKESRLGRPFKIGHSALEKILGRTHGIPIFQEQIMQISIDVAGFSPSEADQLRRSLGQQRTAKSVDEMGQKLYQSLIGNGIPAKFADDLFKYIQGYAHYGFPESHAASYASLAYKSAYMKCHHPDALLCGLINSQPMGFYSVDTLINEAKRSGVQFLPLHPNKSEWGVCLEKSGVVRMGFRELRRINKDDVMHLLEERRCREFSSVEDFIFRTHLSRDVLENLALANCFSCFGLDRRHSFWQSLEFAHLFDRGSGRGQAGQTSLFDERTILQQQTDFFEPMSMLEEIKVDYKKIGYSLQGNLMKGLRLELPQLPPMTSAQVRALRHGDQVQYAGILMALQRPPPAKGTAFITFEDEFGSIDTLFKNEIFEKFEEVIKGSRFLIVEGKVQKKGSGTTVVVSRAESFATFKSIGKPTSPQPCPREMAALRWMK